MSKHKVRLVILCEDTPQEVFARHYFIHRGVNPRRIRVRKSPAAKGSAEQFVRQQYPIEVQAYRQRAGEDIALAVVVDADTRTVAERVKQMDENLETDRQPDERIAIFTPKRNIETWIYYLKGQAVDEETVYPKLQKASECKEDVKRLALEICPAGLPDDAPPSLHAACAELKRILS